METEKSLNRQGGGQRFHQDGFGQLAANPKARVANLTNVRRFTPEQLDLLLLAEAEFAQAIGYVRGGGELFDANHRSGFHFAQWTNLRAGTMALENDIWLRRFSHGDAN